MTDNTSIPTPDPTSWLAQEQEFARLCDSIRPSNKVALFEALAQAGITTVIVEFDGYGDNGQIEDVTAQAGDKVTDLPALNLEIARAEWGRQELAHVTLSIGEAIEQLAYDVLRETHAGWENNEGAYGDFVFDVSERTITLNYNERSKRPNTPSMCFEEAAMAHPYHHALSSARKWGGTAHDYLPLHQWLDESKAITADFRHRALRHHAEGIFMLERLFGATITLSTSRVVPVRFIGEQHVIEDLGFIPSFADWVRCIRPEPWMGRAQPIHRQVDPFALTFT